MDKYEFLEKLKLALNGKVSQQTITDTLRYYDEYIESQAAASSMEQVMNSLGDPRLIARSIVDAESAQTERASQQTQNEQNYNYPDPEKETALRKIGFRLPGIVWAGIGVVVLIAILSLVFKLLAIFGPTIALIALIYFVYKNLSKK